MITAQPIQTEAFGYRFRSRLEARWAVCLTHLGCEWEYEPQGFEIGGQRYLPDFYLPAIGAYVEVKPQALDVRQFTLCSLLPEPCILLVGTPDPYRPLFAVADDRSDLWGGPDAFARYELAVAAGGSSYGWCALAQSVMKQRIWCDFGEGELAYIDDPHWDEACLEARRARFEFGEGV